MPCEGIAQQRERSTHIGHEALRHRQVGQFATEQQRLGPAQHGIASELLAVTLRAGDRGEERSGADHLAALGCVRDENVVVADKLRVRKQSLEADRRMRIVCGHVMASLPWT